jgi:hypothetical protein
MIPEAALISFAWFAAFTATCPLMHGTGLRKRCCCDFPAPSNSPWVHPSAHVPGLEFSAQFQYHTSHDRFAFYAVDATLPATTAPLFMCSPPSSLTPQPQRRRRQLLTEVPSSGLLPLSGSFAPFFSNSPQCEAPAGASQSELLGHVSTVKV